MYELDQLGNRNRLSADMPLGATLPNQASLAAAYTEISKDWLIPRESSRHREKSFNRLDPVQWL